MFIFKFKCSNRNGNGGHESFVDVTVVANGEMAARSMVRALIKKDVYLLMEIIDIDAIKQI